jgi:hypothetical protein
LAERCVRNAEVRGSTPLISINQINYLQLLVESFECRVVRFWHPWIEQDYQLLRAKSLFRVCKDKHSDCHRGEVVLLPSNRYSFFHGAECQKSALNHES